MAIQRMQGARGEFLFTIRLTPLHESPEQLFKEATLGAIVNKNQETALPLALTITLVPSYGATT